MAKEVTEHINILNRLASLAIMKDDLWAHHPDNPKRVNVAQEYAKICAEIAGLEGELAALHQ
jgi:predicted Zn-dependent protease